jgi:hypothetical protein
MGATPDGDIATASMAVIRYADPLCRLKLELSFLPAQQNADFDMVRF